MLKSEEEEEFPFPKMKVQKETKKKFFFLQKIFFLSILPFEYFSSFLFLIYPGLCHRPFYTCNTLRLCCNKLTRLSLQVAPTVSTICE
jgi:hypothetical protein